MNPRIYLSPPHVAASDREAILRAFDSGWIAPLGPEVDAFESEFATYTQTPHAAALSSGTAALHLALVMLGVNPGDTVWVSDFTFAATVNAIRYVGANPVFLDSDAATWNLDANLLGQALRDAKAKNQLPKAIVVVDLYGQCADYEKIVPLCQEFDVPLIEDAAEALGATLHGRSAGTFGVMAAFSFNGNKIITTSGGGMLTSKNEAFIKKARFLATQAREPVSHYEHTHVGYNYRLSNILAALGRSQLATMNARLEARRKNFEFYRESLRDCKEVQFLPSFPGSQPTHWLSCITFAKESAITPETIRLALEKQNIETRPLWKPMHMQPIFAHYPSIGGAVCADLFARGLCLPSGSNLGSADRDRVVTALRNALLHR